MFTSILVYDSVLSSKEIYPVKAPVNYSKYPCQMEDLLTPTEKAESAFKARAKELANEDWETEAWENAFSAETYKEYADDLERWTVALATLEMLADLKGDLS